MFFRGAELFQATIVKAVRARLEEERKSVEQLKRQWDSKHLTFLWWNDVSVMSLSFEPTLNGKVIIFLRHVTALQLSAQEKSKTSDKWRIFFLIMKFNFLLIFFKLNQNFYPVVAIISCFSFLLSEIYPYIPWKKIKFYYFLPCFIVALGCKYIPTGHFTRYTCSLTQQ